MIKRLFGYPILALVLSVLFVVEFIAVAVPTFIFGAVCSLLAGLVLHGGSTEWVLQSGLDFAWFMLCWILPVVMLATTASIVGVMSATD